MAQEVINQVKSLKGNRNDYKGTRGGILLFPLDLRDNPDRPCIRFKCAPTQGGDGGSVFFPCPPNVTIGDGANYSAIQGGALVAGINKVKAAAGEGGNVTQILSNLVKGGVDSVTEKIKSGQGMELAQLGAGALGVGADLQGLISLQSQTITNPNTNNAFGGNTVRSFQFQFKLIAKSKQESTSVNNIHKFFRRNLYGEKAGESGLQLRYQPVWNIDFMNVQQSGFGDGSNNSFLPKIHSCYLTQVNSTFNAGSQTFHDDGAPTEVDLNLSLVETRALNKNDIENLEGEQNLQELRGVDSITGGAQVYNQ